MSEHVGPSLLLPAPVKGGSQTREKPKGNKSTSGTPALFRTTWPLMYTWNVCYVWHTQVTSPFSLTSSPNCNCALCNALASSYLCVPKRCSLQLSCVSAVPSDGREGKKHFKIQNISCWEWSNSTDLQSTSALFHAVAAVKNRICRMPTFVWAGVSVNASVQSEQLLLLF